MKSQPNAGPPGSRPVFGVAVRLLASKRLTKAQLGKKLRDRGFAPDAVRDAVGECERRRYLDDRTFAQLYVKSMLERKPVGPLRLLRELLRQGVEQSVARAALDELDNDEEARIEQAVRKLEAMRPGDRPDRLARRLHTMGYAPPAIARVLRRRAQGGFIDTLEEMH
ncbi:MAG: recombination regulator RecX [Candidatus Eremiobacteraeota bacterium]|nr:recombination regulator RecX [Candidatus Eremiobacteraeota bacterium]